MDGTQGLLREVSDVLGVVAHCAAGVGVPPGTNSLLMLQMPTTGKLRYFGGKVASARIIAHRERNIGVVTVARKLVTNVYCGLRDGELRALVKGAA